MDRMLFNSDATKLLSELQYLNQNQNQNQSWNTGNPRYSYSHASHTNSHANVINTLSNGSLS